MGLLSVIFEVNLKLFGEQSQKKIVFVVRDFKDHDNTTEIDLTVKKIRTDVENIWQKIYKPEEHKGKTIYEFFEFEFKMLPNLEWQEQEWHIAADKLKERFAYPSSGLNSFFLPKPEDRIVPIDGLHFYLE